MNSRFDSFLNKHWRPLRPFSKMMIFITFIYLGAAVITNNVFLGIIALACDIITLASFIYPRKNGTQEEKA